MASITSSSAYSSPMSGGRGGPRRGAPTRRPAGGAKLGALTLVVPTIRFELVVAASPDAVMRALTDFSDNRPDAWPNIDHSHFRVHSLGPGWADVTEGNVLAWERNRYDWR